LQRDALIKAGVDVANQLIASFFIIFLNFIKVIIFHDYKMYNRMIFS
jgi:hypothetical protein